MSASPAVRSLRAAVFAAVCVLLAAAGHGLAMGDMPPVPVDAVGCLGVFALGWLLGGRERSLPGICAAMLATQAALHVAFDAAHRSAPPPAHAPHMASMHMASMSSTSSTSPMDMAGLDRPHLVITQLVTAHATAAHLLAALIASWWLRRGEAALWSLLRRAVALVPGLAAWWRDAPLPARAGRPLRATAGPGTPRPLPLLRHAVNRRGPPHPIPYPI
ncbi:hypothetical protein [Streptomyces sp. NPDC006739]|uniref:hypothetical protein n=1 Tax=Streptomyces sp. NPDC006739 TaxID=3364763 RepID=UPI00369B0EFD